MYQDFNPLRLQQSAKSKVLEFGTFDAALDDFFSKVWKDKGCGQGCGGISWF